MVSLGDVLWIDIFEFLLNCCLICILVICCNVLVIFLLGFLVIFFVLIELIIIFEYCLLFKFLCKDEWIFVIWIILIFLFLRFFFEFLFVGKFFFIFCEKVGIDIFVVNSIVDWIVMVILDKWRVFILYFLNLLLF